MQIVQGNCHLLGARVVSQRHKAVTAMHKSIMHFNMSNKTLIGSIDRFRLEPSRVVGDRHSSGSTTSAVKQRRQSEEKKAV